MRLMRRFRLYWRVRRYYALGLEQGDYAHQLRNGIDQPALKPWMFYMAYEIAGHFWHRQLGVFVCRLRGHQWEEYGDGPYSEMACRRCCISQSDLEDRKRYE